MWTEDAKYEETHKVIENLTINNIIEALNGRCNISSVGLCIKESQS